MGDKDNFVKIYNDFMTDVETYGHREQFFYLLLKGVANNINGASIVDIEQIASIMGLSSHSKNRKAIQEILLSMEENKLLLLYSDMMMTKSISVSEIKLTSVYYASLAEFSCKGKGFTKIYNRDVLKFMSIEEKSKDLLFAVYFNIVRRIYNSESSANHSWVTIDKIAEETGINRKTVMGKVAIMMECQILFCLKVSESSEKDKNYYCRWEDRQMLIDEMANGSDD